MKPTFAIVAALAVACAASASVVGQSTTNEDFCLALDEAVAADVDITECVAFIQDSVYVIEGPPSAATAEGEPGSSSTAPEWNVEPIELDPMSDRATAVTWLDATSGTNRFGTPVRLVIACDQGTTNVVIVWEEFLGLSDDRPKVDMRVGDGKVTSQRWHQSTSNEATFYPKNTKAFIKSLFGASRLVLRTTPYGRGPLTAEFDIDGIEDAVANVRQACDW